MTKIKVLFPSHMAQVQTCYCTLFPFFHPSKSVAVLELLMHFCALQLSKCPFYSYWKCSIICCCGMWVPYPPRLDAWAPVVPHFHDKKIQCHGEKRKQKKQSVLWHDNREVFPGHMDQVQTCDDCKSAKRRSLSSWRVVMYHSSHSSILWRMEFLELHSVHFIKCPLCSDWKCSNIFYWFVGPYVESIPNSKALVLLFHSKLSSKRKTEQAIPGQMQTCACIKYCREVLLKKTFFLILCVQTTTFTSHLSHVSNCSD